ncbi:MAG TPA: cache domain-containing protein [Nevskiales bacterium]|nr:cache domain-containing protein [Nevskiales bacterium]
MRIASSFAAVLGIGLAFGVGVLYGEITIAQSEPAADPPQSRDEQRALFLLERAVEHIRKNGASAVVDFSRQAEFVDRDLYVYALTKNGDFLASGGGSAALIGMNVLAETDMAGKPFFREIVELAKTQGAGRIEYQWFNPADSRGEPKVTLFRAVGDIIVAVGFYPPRATPTQAKALLRAAIEALQKDEQAALSAFQKFGGPFIRDDLYVFVVSLEDGQILAHGASPALVGTDGNDIRDPDGRPIVSEMIQIARDKGDGELTYSWLNPTTKRLERKHTYFRVVANKLLGVGYYTR